jgi:hypothetical protein
MVIVVASAAAWIACGGQEQHAPPYSGPPEDAPSLPFDDFCAQYAQVACDFVGRCCSGIPVPNNCASYGPQLCDDLRKAEPTGKSYDPVAGAVCVAAMREASGCTGAALVGGSDAFGYAACSVLFNGGVAPGGACTNAVGDCAYVRHAVTSCVGGVCVAKPIVESGASCASAICDVDLVCATSSSTCIPAATEGQSCASTTCRHDLFCDTTTKTCAALLADGAACMSSLSCASSVCSSGKCSSTTVCTL